MKVLPRLAIGALMLSALISNPSYAGTRITGSIQLPSSLFEYRPEEAVWIGQGCLDDSKKDGTFVALINVSRYHGHALTLTYDGYNSTLGFGQGGSLSYSQLPTCSPDALMDDSGHVVTTGHPGTAVVTGAFLLIRANVSQFTFQARYHVDLS